MFHLSYDRPGAPPMYQGRDDDVGGSNAEINAALPGVPVGTIIHTAGYGTMKQLGFGGQWATLGGDS